MAHLSAALKDICRLTAAPALLPATPTSPSSRYQQTDRQTDVIVTTVYATPPYRTVLLSATSHTHTTVLLLFWNMSGTTRVSRYQKGKTRKGKTNLDLLEQEIVSGSGISWAICKSASHPRQPRQHPTTQFFTVPLF